MGDFLIGNGSMPVQKPVLPGSPRISLSRQISLTGDKNLVQSPRISMHFPSKDTPAKGINRASSDITNFSVRWSLNRTGSGSFLPSLPDEEEFLLNGVGRTIRRRPVHDGIPLEEPGFGGDGGDHGNVAVGGWSDGERIKIGKYYEEMLKSNPTDALLLTNYGKFLHEVEKDTAKAEEYYGRAILANACDGELLSLYGKLIWEKERDQERAKCYFDQAIHVAPHDCMVLGSYAHFMWETEEEEEEEEEKEEVVNGGGIRTQMIAAF